MFYRNPDDEQNQFELRYRNTKFSAGNRGIEKNVLKRNPVILRQIVADNELVVSMHMNEATR